MTAPRLSVGPLPFHWPRQTMLDFYRVVARGPADIVYLGETVCSKRREFGHADWVATAERLVETGKEVVFSTLALVEAQSEVGYLRRLCESGDFTIEANDMSAVQLLADRTSFVGGPSLNINNPRSLGRLIDLGLSRWVAPVEMTRTMHREIREATSSPIEYELLTWGRLPLAWSARCYTARARDRNKDDCGNCCIDYPDGLGMKTRDGEDFLVLNGIQTMSARTLCLVGDDIRSGVADILRISPQAEGIDTVLGVLDALRHGVAEPAEVLQVLDEFAPGGFCDGYWHGTAGMACSEAAPSP